MSDQNFVELRWIYVVIRRWWWLIAGLAIFAAVITFVITAIMPPVYQSSAELLVNPSKSSNTSQYNELMAGTQLALTYSKMVKDRPVLETVISELGLSQSTDALSKQISAEPVSSSQIIKLTVQDNDPEQAALIANTLADAFTKRVEALSVQRYAGILNNTKDRTAELQTQINDTQAQIDSLRSAKVTKDVVLGTKQTSLATLQTDYRSLQNSYQDLQNTVVELTGNVYIVEQAQVRRNTLRGTSTAAIIVSVGQGQNSSGNNTAEDRLPLTYGQLIINTQFLNGIITQLGLPETPEQLSGMTGYELVTGTRLLRLYVDYPDEANAQLVVEALANAFLARVKDMLSEPYSDRLNSMQKQIIEMESSINDAQVEIGQLSAEISQMTADLDRLENNLASTQNDYRDSVQKYDQLLETAAQTSDAVIITEPASPPKSPSQNRLLYIVLSTCIGLIGGVGLSFLMNYINSPIRTNQDVRSAINMPVLSTIGQLARNENDLVMVFSPSSVLAEDFRTLGQKIRLIIENDQVKTLLVTSPDPSEGKSMIISNLAISLSRTGLRVVVVDADLRLPRLHNLFGLSQIDGLTNSLNSQNIDGALQSTGIGELKILTSGKITSNPAEILSLPYLEELLLELKKKSDLVLIDCPPILTASDASILASKVDAVLLVLRSGATESGAAQDAVDALHQVKARLLGIVLNSVPNRKKSYYYHS